jgi:cell division protein FtsQ
MDKGKVVALEDRIPKLKEQRRRKANKRLIILLCLFFIMIVAVAYTQSPLSHVKTIMVKGNQMYTSSEIIKKTGLSTNTNIWKVKTDKVANGLKRLPEIKKASVSIHWPNTINIQIQEHKRIAYIEKDSAYYPVQDNGEILENRKIEQLPINSPILFKFNKGPVLNEMIKGLQALPNEILNSISEVHYSPKKTDQYHISLFMNDGFEVSATLRTFAEKMVHYPSIISQLDPNKKGIIDLEVGSFFKAFEPEVEDKQSEKDKGQG